MNIFWLINTWPRLIPYDDLARLYCDQHVLKIILEITQMLYAAWHELEDGQFPPSFLHAIEDSHKPKGYSPTHVNHPMCIWIRNHCVNYTTVATLGLSLCDEYLVRYPKPTPHACRIHLEALLIHVPPHIPKRGCFTLTIPPICGVPEHLKGSSCDEDSYCSCCHRSNRCDFKDDGTTPVIYWSIHNPAESYRRYYTHVKIFEMHRFTYTNVPVPRFVLDGFREQLHTRVWDELWPSLRLILCGHKEEESPFSRLSIELVGMIERYVLAWPYVKPPKKRRGKRKKADSI